MGITMGIAGIADEEDAEDKTDGMETSRTETTLSDSSPPTEIISESETASPPPLVLASTIHDNFDHLFDEAIATCVRHERTDIILTYVCNLRATPKDVDQICAELKHIVHLQDSITSTFVPIRY